MTDPGAPNSRPHDPDQVAAVAALAPYFSALRSHLRLVVAIVLVAVLAAIGWTRVQGTSYEATAEILVVPVPADDLALAGLPLLRAGEADTSRAVETAATLLESDAAGRAAARALGEPINEQTVDSAVEVEVNDPSDLVEITATSTSPERAADIANAYATAALDLRARELKPLIDAAAQATRSALDLVEDANGVVADELRARLSALEATTADPSLALVREASPPSAPTGSPLWLVVGFALIGGLVIAALTAVLSEVLAPRVLRQEDDLVRVFPRPVLARVPELPRRELTSGRGRRRAAAAREGFRSVRGQLAIRADERRRAAAGGGTEEGTGTVVLITSPGRGDGRTGAARGLAWACGAAGSSVILLDADLRKTAVGGDRDSDGLRALAEGKALDDALQPIPGLTEGGLLSAPAGLEMSEIDRLSVRMPSIIGECRRSADWVIVDAPAFVAAGDAIPLLEVIDELVVVVRRNHTGLTQLARLRDLLRQLEVSPVGYLVVGGVRIAEARYYGEDEPLPWSSQADKVSLAG